MQVFVKPQSFKNFGRKWRREHGKWLQANLSLNLLGWPRATTAIATQFSLAKPSQRLATPDPNVGK